MKKYVVVPGYVISRSDGDKHFISASQLIRLYKVDPKECRITSGIQDVPYSKDYIILTPRQDGNYNLDLQ